MKLIRKLIYLFLGAWAVAYGETQAALPDRVGTSPDFCRVDLEAPEHAILRDDLRGAMDQATQKADVFALYLPCASIIARRSGTPLQYDAWMTVSGEKSAAAPLRVSGAWEALSEGLCRTMASGGSDEPDPAQRPAQQLTPTRTSRGCVYVIAAASTGEAANAIAVPAPYEGEPVWIYYFQRGKLMPETVEPRAAVLAETAAPLIAAYEDRRTARPQKQSDTSRIVDASLRGLNNGLFFGLLFLLIAVGGIALMRLIPVLKRRGDHAAMVPTDASSNLEASTQSGSTSDTIGAAAAAPKPVEAVTITATTAETVGAVASSQDPITPTRLNWRRGLQRVWLLTAVIWWVVVGIYLAFSPDTPLQSWPKRDYESYSTFLSSPEYNAILVANSKKRSASPPSDNVETDAVSKWDNSARDLSNPKSGEKVLALYDAIQRDIAAREFRDAMRKAQAEREAQRAQDQIDEQYHTWLQTPSGQDQIDAAYRKSILSWFAEAWPVLLGWILFPVAAGAALWGLWRGGGALLRWLRAGFQSA
jgi:hypothetical protein